jgi:hypothetical protein
MDEGVMKTMVKLGVLAVAITISVRGLFAEDLPPAPRPSSAPTPPAEPRPATPTPAEVGPTRLFFVPTARSLPRGKGTAGLTEVAFPWVDVGLTTRVSLMGAGVLPLEGLSDGGVVVAPKVQLLSGRRVQGAIGAAHFFCPGETGGVAYGVVTVGSAGTAVTVGGGYGYGQLADSGGSPAVFFLGGEKALGRSWRLVVEGLVGGAALGLPDQTVVGGVRFSRGRWSADVGAVVPIYETGSGMPFPVFTVARAF